MKLIVGLGNPGKRYEGTRHNLGFAAVDKLADSMQRTENNWENNKKLKASVLRNTLILAKPQTFMNLSGEAVNLLLKYFRISVSDLIIVHDDLDLPLGKIKIRLGGGAGGHHGVESIINALNNDQFIRVRLGIGPGVEPTEEFVLENFALEDQPKVKEMVKKAAGSVEVILKEGLEAAQNKYN